MSVIGSNILAGASGQGGGYNLTNSLRFRSSASAYLNRTPASAGNRRTWTFSTWIKLGEIAASNGTILSAGTTSGVNTRFYLRYTGSQFQTGYGSQNLDTTVAVYRDPSAWYHVVLAVDTTQATASNRIKIYVNGVQQTVTTSVNYSQNDDTPINNNVAQNIGRDLVIPGGYFDGYLSETYIIDGQALTPSSFGETSATTGVWIPKKYTGTYGTNGFYLQFTNTSSTSTLGNDFSGNSNTWTVNNISLTAGSTYDSMTDVPTLTSATAANYSVMNPVAMTSNVSATNGNLTTSFTGLNNAAIYGTFMLPTSGKWYFEDTITTVNTASSQDAGFGIVDATTTLSNISAQTFSNGVIYRNRGDSDSRIVVNGSSVVSGSGYSWSSGDIVQIAYDADSGKVWVGRNNSWFDTSGGTTGNPSSGTNQIGTLTTTINMLPVARAYSNTLVMNWNFGQRPFAYTPPTGFNRLNTFNLPTPTIGATTSTQAGKYFNTVLYTGNGGSQSVTGVGFKPDLTWVKVRSSTQNHSFNDAVRGAGYYLVPNATAAERLQGEFDSFDTDGFSLTYDGAEGDYNGSGKTYVAWNWRASNATAVTNTAGSITSTVSANTSAGFSIVTYTGTGSNATVGHGLGVAPSMVIVKRRNGGSDNWQGYHISLGKDYTIKLNTTQAQENLSDYWGTGGVTSTVFGINGSYSGINANGGTYVAYCFAQVAGYSAFGSYIGNGSSDGPFIYTGFRPRFVMCKRTNTTGDWVINDTSRNPSNVMNLWLYPNVSDADTTFTFCDFVSNGFKLRAGPTALNNNGDSYIYMAFAESPFKYANAR